MTASSEARRMRRMATLAALVAATALAACGGGSDSPAPAPTPTPSPSPSATPSPSPSPAPSPSADRIEPYDPSASRSAAAPRAASAAVLPRALVADGEVAQLVLAPLADGALPPPAKGVGVATQIGVARVVSALASSEALAARLHWAAAADGTQVAALRVTSPGAKGLRLGLRVEALPPGALLRFYARAGGELFEVTAAEVLATVERNLQAGVPSEEARTYWSPDFGGAETTVEVALPAGVSTAGLRLALPRVSHNVLSAQDVDAQGFQTKVGESGSCQVDVTCRPDYTDQSRSVARLYYVSGGKGYYCTGTLLNDMRSSGTPHLLTANHCISTQAEASTLVTNWFYRSATCNSAAVNPATQRRAGGATFLYGTAATDTTLLRLNEAPPEGVVYAGSYFGLTNSGTALAGVHHPKGDLQKLSEGTLSYFANCVNASCTATTQESGQFLGLAWSNGVTEVGSSGSAVFQTLGSKRYVVGQLLGGASSCAVPSALDFYGRFDTAYRRALYQWLNP
jgi:lysyl endopeptidase